MQLNVNDLLVFLTITETRSITAAADKTGLTKSAVSQALKRAEDQVGAKLLFRTTRSMTLTDQGARLIPYCRSLRQAHQDVMDVLSQSGADVRDALTITAPHALSQSLLIPVLSDLFRHRNLKLRLLAEDSPVNLVERQIDLAIRVGGTAPQAARITRIGGLRESIYASEAYLKQMGGAPDSLQDLAGWTHIANDWQGDPILYQTFDGARLRIAPMVRCNTVRDVSAFVRQGLGVGLLPDIVAEQDGDLTHVIAVTETPVYAVHQHGARPPKNIRDTITALRTALRYGDAPTS